MSYIFREQGNLPIGPVGVGQAINIPVKAIGLGFEVDGNGGVMINSPGLYMATWNVPSRLPAAAPIPDVAFNVVITLNKVNDNEIIGRSASNVSERGFVLEEFSEAVTGSAIFRVTEPNTLIQLVNSSILPIIVPIHAGAGINPIGAGASLTIHRVVEGNPPRNIAQV